MNAEQSSFIHRLNGKNFRLWKFQVQAVLQSHGLLEIVTDTVVPTEEKAKQDWLKHDGKAMAILIGALESEQVQLVLTCKNAKEIWNKLLTIHDKKSEVSVMNLYEEYFALKMNEDENVATYVSKVMKLAAEIEDQGEKLSDNIKMVRIISSLTPKFKNFKTVWYNIKEGRDLDNLLARLQLEEDQINKSVEGESSTVAFSAKHHKTFKKQFRKQEPKLHRSIEEKKKFTRCNACREFGHWERECPTKNKTKYMKKPEKHSHEFAFTSTVEEVMQAASSEIWIADSGASQHMCFRKEWFSEFTESKDSKYVKVANNEHLQILGFGTIHIEALVHNQWEPRKLENVQYVPKLTQNLFSTGEITRKGFSMLIKSDYCNMYDNNKYIVATGVRDKNNQYRMCFRVREDGQWPIWLKLTLWKNGTDVWVI